MRKFLAFVFIIGIGVSGFLAWAYVERPQDWQVWSLKIQRKIAGVTGKDFSELEEQLFLLKKDVLLEKYAEIKADYEAAKIQIEEKFEEVKAKLEEKNESIEGEMVKFQEKIDEKKESFEQKKEKIEKEIVETKTQYEETKKQLKELSESVENVKKETKESVEVIKELKAMIFGE
jgi:chromosome segregation ATPase